MRNRFVTSVVAWMAVVAFSPVLRAQQTAAPDLSGPWARGEGGFGSSLSLSDPRQAKRGNEDDIP